jgi:hypothetical protein
MPTNFNPIHTNSLHPPTHKPDHEVDPDEEPELQMQLVWAHTPTYPDEPPSIRLRSIKGLSDKDLQEATDELQRHIEVGHSGKTHGI